MSKNQLLRWCGVILVGWYLAVCAIHYLGQRSLWNDEVAVLSSIEVFGPFDFFNQPLRMVQVFPHFYLFLIQLFASFFDNSILSLRFLPYICMMTAYVYWLRIAGKELTNLSDYVTFLLCWCASVPLIYYSAELKQYSMDVLVCGLFVWFLYHQKQVFKSSPYRYALILTVLPVCVFFSYPAYFLLILPFWNLCIDFKSDRSHGKFLLVYLISLSVCVAVSYQIDIRLRPVEIVTGGFNDYFIATNSFKDFFQTFGEGVNNLFSRWFVELPKVFRKIARIFMFFGLVYMVLGFFKNIRKGHGRIDSVKTIALIVFLELAVAGAMYKYPFGVPRTALFLSPMLLILTIQAMSELKSINKYLNYVFHGAFVIYLTVVALGILGVVMTRPLNAIPKIWVP